LGYSDQLYTDGYRIASWTAVKLAFEGAVKNGAVGRVSSIKLYLPQQQFNKELGKQALHIQEVHAYAFSQLTPAVEEVIENRFVDWLASCILDPKRAPQDLGTTLGVAWDLNLPVTRHGHVEVSFVMKIVRVAQLMPCIRPTSGSISIPEVE
jgi:hypothetical protein